MLAVVFLVTWKTYSAYNGALFPEHTCDCKTQMAKHWETFRTKTEADDRAHDLEWSTDAYDVKVWKVDDSEVPVP